MEPAPPAQSRVPAPTIQVVDRTDGTDLVAEQSMTEADGEGNSGILYHNEDAAAGQTRSGCQHPGKHEAEWHEADNVDDHILR